MIKIFIDKIVKFYYKWSDEYYSVDKSNIRDGYIDIKELEVKS